MSSSSPPASAALPSTTTAEDSSDLTQLPGEGDGKHYSITQSLALEHQLNEMDPDADDAPPPTAASLNPEVLSSVIVSMRESFAQERSHFASALADANSKNASLEARCADMEEELRASQDSLKASEDKLADSEHSLTMLRQTLEESRRGIMRLQTENKRSSTLIMGAPPTPGAAASGGTTSRANKRLSLNPNLPLPPFSASVHTPRTPGNHRRISSLSDPGAFGAMSAAGGESYISRIPSSPSPNSTFAPLPTTPGNNPNALSTSPPSSLHSGLPSPGPDPALTAQLESLRAELSQTKRSLTDAIDARIASEEIVKGLRELIAAHSNDEGVLQSTEGLSGLRLPPLPSDPDIGSHGDGETKPVELKKTAAGGGWGSLKLWREPSSGNGKATDSPPAVPPKFDRSTSSGSNSIMSDRSEDRDATLTMSPPPPAPAAPMAALGNLMGSWRRGSAASAPSTPDPSVIIPTSSSNSSIHGETPPAGPDSVTSPVNSFRSKFGFFSKVATAAPAPATTAGAETASINSVSSRPMSVSTSEFLHSTTGNDTVQVVNADDGDDDDAPIQEISLHDEHDPSKLDVSAMKGDMTPTTARSGAGFAI